MIKKKANNKYSIKWEDENDLAYKPFIKPSEKGEEYFNCICCHENL